MEFDSAEDFESYLHSTKRHEEEASRSQRRVFFWRSIAAIPSVLYWFGFAMLVLFSVSESLRNAVFGLFLSACQMIVG